MFLKSMVLIFVCFLQLQATRIVYIFIAVIGDSFVDPSSLQQLELSVAEAVSVAQGGHS